MEKLSGHKNSRRLTDSPMEREAVNTSKSMLSEKDFRLQFLMLEDSEELLSNLASGSIKTNIVTGKEPLEQLKPRHGLVEEDEYPRHLLDLELATGDISLGHSEQQNQVSLVVENDLHEDSTIANSSVKKQVFTNRPSRLNRFSQSFHSQDWQEGATAVVAPEKSPIKKIMNNMGKFVEKGHGASLSSVMPFLTWEQEKKDQDLLRQTRSQLSLRDSKGSKNVSEVKQDVEEQLATKEQVIKRKKDRKQEVTSKLEHVIVKLQHQAQELTHTGTNDQLDILLKNRLEMLIALTEDILQKQEDEQS